jgi:predicted transcriptional regulator
MNEPSSTELEVLEYLWKENEPKKSSEIMNHFNTVLNKEWKKQTVNTFLLNLKKKGYLSVSKRLNKTVYFPLITREDYYKRYTQSILNNYFQGSLKNFISAFTGNTKLSALEKESLLEYIKNI